MSKELVSDELWEIIKPLLPEEPPKPNGGRPRIDDRAALTGIVFVLKSGIPWEMLPQEMGCGSGSTCWRRLRDWQEAGVWEELHRVLLDRLGEADRIDWVRASLDSASVPATRGTKEPARIRRIRERRALKAPCCGRPRRRAARGSSQRRQRPRQRRSWKRRWMPSSRSRARVLNPVGGASARRSCTPTKPTTSPVAVRL